MEKIRIKNYRSIEDSGQIELAPITVLVGRNSSGKSSFIRLFPLLKQTVEKKVSEPILWYGDYVDLGDYEHAISNFNKETPIELTLMLEVSPNRYYHNMRYIKKYMAEVTVSIKKEYINYLKIEIVDQKIEIHYRENSNIEEIKINGDNSLVCVEKCAWYREEGGLLPELYEMEKIDDEKIRHMPYQNRKLQKKINKAIYTDSEEKEEPLFWRRNIIGEIRIGSKEEVLKSIQKNASEEHKEKFNKMNISHKRFLNLNNQILAVKLGDILAEINSAISIEMRNTNYVKPIRAMVDRFYRVQGINIEELDSDGSNLPMILYNMSPNDLKNFERWSKDKFGIVFSVDNTIGHVSLVIKNELDSKDKTNLADTGYGYSQMLPIVVLLWMLHNKYGEKDIIRKSIVKTIVIEQPELHLHPAYQAKMIDVFVNILKEAKSLGINLKIIFETHSEAMIVRLGKLISNKELENGWVKIFIFDKINEKTEINEKTFNEKGLLCGWPIGFFAADEVM